MEGAERSNSSLVFTAHLAMTIDDQRLIHAVVHTKAEDASAPAECAEAILPFLSEDA
jgi:hypothetical protein